MKDDVNNTGRVAPAEARAESLLWSAAFAVLATTSLVLLVNLIVRATQLGVPAGIYKSAKLTEVIYYLATWLIISLAVCALAFFRKHPAIVLCLVCILTVEFGSARLHRFVTGRNFGPEPLLLTGRFTPHPLLQGIPNPGKFGRFTHTAGNLRLTINSGKTTNATLISAFGGSTTYDVGLADNATWASALSAVLGSNYIVENHGVPGYSTVEHIIQTMFDLRRKKPKCAIYYVGWNDLRNSNQTDLRPDYSNFHLQDQKGNLGLKTSSSLLVRRSAFFSILSNVGNKKLQPIGEIKHHYDQRLSDIFKENVRLIAIVAGYYGVKPIFIPQVLNYDKFSAHRPYGWLPFVNDADIKELMASMNADLAEVARETQSPFLGEVLRVAWKDPDFVDKGHFSPSGSRKFAEVIADRIAIECR